MLFNLLLPKYTFIFKMWMNFIIRKEVSQINELYFVFLWILPWKFLNNSIEGSKASSQFPSMWTVSEALTGKTTSIRISERDTLPSIFAELNSKISTSRLHLVEKPSGLHLSFNLSGRILIQQQRTDEYAKACCKYERHKTVQYQKKSTPI